MAAQEILQLRIIGTVVGETFNNVLHFRQRVADTGTAAELAANFNTNLSNAWVNATGDEMSITRYEARALTPEIQDPETAVPGDGVGNLTGDSLPSFCAAVVKISTGFSSRRKRGRFFIAGLVESQQDGGVLIASAITQMQAIVTALEGQYGPSGTSDWEMGVYSRASIADGTADMYTAFTPMTSLSVSSIISTQRRRRLG